MDNLNKINKEILEEIKNRLVEIYHPKLIYLFGSYAWGVPDKNSDFDFFIVVDKSDMTMTDRMRLGYSQLIGVSKPLDIIVYTEKEFESRKEHPSSLSYKVLHKGVILYEAA